MNRPLPEPAVTDDWVERAAAALPQGIEPEAIRKLEIDRHGRLTLEVDHSGGRRWFAWRAEGVQEIDPAADAKLPLAARLRDPEFRQAARILSYRRHRRLTLLDRSGQKPRIVKGFRAGTDAGMLERYEHAHQALLGSFVNAPEVIDHDAGLAALILVLEPGERLALGAEHAEEFHHVGEALRAFQESGGAQPWPSHSADSELAVIDERARRMAVGGLSLPPGFGDLRERLQEIRPSLAPTRLALAHRDLHDRQFIRHARYFTLLDFDLMCRADATLDPANLLAHLVLRLMQGVQGASQFGIDRAGKKLLQGLDRNEQPGFWERLRFYQATTFCRLALVYRLRPRWTGLTPQLLVMGHRCLDDLQRIRRQ